MAGERVIPLSERLGEPDIPVVTVTASGMIIEQWVKDAFRSQIVRQLGETRGLAVFDEYEHVIDATNRYGIQRDIDPTVVLDGWFIEFDVNLLDPGAGDSKILIGAYVNPADDTSVGFEAIDEGGSCGSQPGWGDEGDPYGEGICSPHGQTGSMYWGDRFEGGPSQPGSGATTIKDDDDKPAEGKEDVDGEEDEDESKDGTDEDEGESDASDIYGGCLPRRHPVSGMVGLFQLDHLTTVMSQAGVQSAAMAMQQVNFLRQFLRHG